MGQYTDLLREAKVVNTTIMDTNEKIYKYLSDDEIKTVLKTIGIPDEQIDVCFQQKGEKINTKDYNEVEKGVMTGAGLMPIFSKNAGVSIDTHFIEKLNVQKLKMKSY